ncbi:PhoH family protein [bacterium]|nr:PhoH family protein [Betaproteobacteria bacterium]NDE16723.1 PhoH family protein [bacterium]
MAAKQRNVRRAEKKSKKRQEQQEKAKAPLTPCEIEWRTETQRRAWKALSDNDITFLLGSAGSGKTFLAMAYAINEILAKRASQIVLTRPIVDAGEKLGYLPGSFGEKVNPYMQPLYDTMDVLLGKFGPKREFVNKAVVLAPLCYLRGRTFNDSICVFDEAQNATYTQFKLFLSRFGQNSKIIVTGDPQQTDLPISPPPMNEVVTKLKGVAGIDVVQFAHSDVVRHPLVAAILKKL